MRRNSSEPAAGETLDGLEQLQTALAQERAERMAIEQALGRAHALLARAQAKLIDTQAGAQRARHLAYHDPLTSLPNLRYFQAQLKARLTRTHPPGRSLAVLFIDLDGFKQINDQNGHRTGDALLRITAARMLHAVRETDLVSRIGGDEFACLIDGLPDRDQLRRVACKLFGSICAPMMIRDRSFLVRPSIGIAISPDHGSTPNLLLESADDAMYAAKRQQIGYSFFDAALRRETPTPRRPQHAVAL